MCATYRASERMLSYQCAYVKLTCGLIWRPWHRKLQMQPFFAEAFGKGGTGGLGETHGAVSDVYFRFFFTAAVFVDFRALMVSDLKFLRVCSRLLSTVRFSPYSV